MNVSIYAIVGWSVVAFAMLAVIFLAMTAHRRRVDQAVARMGGLAEPTFRKERLESIHVPCNTSLRFALHPEDERTHRMRQSDALVEMQTGDFGFDARIYLECDDTRVGAWLRRDADARTLIAALVGPRRSLELRKGRLVLSAGDFDQAGGGLAEDARKLQALAALVPVVSGADSATAAQRIRLRVVHAFAWVVLISGLLAGSFAFADLHHPFPQHVSLAPLLAGAALAGMVLATAAYLLALRALRSTSHAPRQASELVVLVWIPVVALTVIAAHQYNLKAGAGEEQVAIGESAGVYRERARRGWKYYFVLRPLDEGRIPEAHYRSTPQLNEQLPYGRRVRVYYREGPLVSFILTRAPEPLPDAR